MKVGYRTGWGRNVRTKISLLDISELVEQKDQKRVLCGLAIGLGRSYGDSSLNSFGTSFSTDSLKSIRIDKHSEIADCGAGVTIGELERAAIGLGLFPKVVPGTEFVTVGGAIASNIHGKSHQKFGSFGDHILEFSLLSADGVKHVLKPQGTTREIFWATVGGMGLTGAIISAKIKLMKIESAYVINTEVRAHSIGEVLATLREFDAKYQYTVAWIDFSGHFNGRGIISGANPAKILELPKEIRSKPLVTSKPRNFSIPDTFPSLFINRFTVAVFNFYWFHKRLNCGIQHLRPYLHPLDSIRNWNRVFGKKGFIQYQIVVPFEHEEFIETVLSEMRKIGGVSFLGVIKSFGTVESRYLSFTKPGWTLAIDVNAANKQINETLDRLDKTLISIGGRVYLTKDSRLNSEDFAKMYPEHSEWLEIKREIDPGNFWQSDQGKRLGLC